MWTIIWLQFWRSHGKVDTVVNSLLVFQSSAKVLYHWEFVWCPDLISLHAGYGYGQMEQPFHVDGVAQTPRAQPERLIRPHGLQLVPVALTRCPSTKVEWKAQKRGTLAPLVAQEASTQIERPILRDILSGQCQGPLVTVALGTTNRWRLRLLLRYSWEFSRVINTSHYY